MLIKEKSRVLANKIKPEVLKDKSDQFCYKFMSFSGHVMDISVMAVIYLSVS